VALYLLIYLIIGPLKKECQRNVIKMNRGRLAGFV